MLYQLASLLSLERFDAAWRTAAHDSVCGRIFAIPKKIADKVTSGSAAQFGTLLQRLGFCVTVVLLTSLVLPQFANDKEGLALISLGGFALWLAGYLLNGRETRKTSFIDFIVLAFFAVNIVATAASHYLGPSVRGLAKESIYIATYFFLTAVLRNSPQRKGIIVATVLIAASAVSLHGLYQYKIGVEPLATWEDPTVETQGTRIFSTLGNPNLLAGYLVPLVPLAISVGLSQVFAARWLRAVIPFAVAGLIATATVLTGSRGGYIGLFVGGAAIASVAAARFLQERPKARPAILAACVLLPIVVAVGLHFVPSFEQRLTSIFAFREHSSNAFRMFVWESSFRMFKDNWWIGIGPGNKAFVLAYGLYMRSGFDALGTYCVPLEIAVETGIIGLLIFAVLLISLFGRAHLSFWAASESTDSSGNGNARLERWLAAGAAAGIMALMAHGLVDTVFFRPQVHFLFWLLVALIVTSPSDKTDHSFE
ncbi:MAG TPA: O-antigen ligase family protein [Chroococcales cyanobacterium]